MSPSDRQVGLAFVVCLLLVTSGCTAIPHSSAQKFLVVEIVYSVPEQAPVTPLDNESVQQSPVLVDAVSEIVNDNRSTVGRPLSDSEYRSVRRAVDPLPIYEGPNETGIYIRSGETTVTIAFLKQS